MTEKQEKKSPSRSFSTGVIALVFLAVGYQTALFIHNAAVTGIAATRDSPDTVYIYLERGPESGSGDYKRKGSPVKTERRNAAHSPTVSAVRKNTARRQYENFRFDPNTVSVEDLVRLGFSQKQAETIDAYRQKGGRFARKADFARSYVVEDSVFKRLEPYIDIPLLDINTADSAQFDALPGIGPYFAAKMVSYRRELGGYSFPEQLMDIWRFDSVRFSGLKDLITVGPSAPFRLWTLPEDSLKFHPYIRGRAHGVVLFRENNSPENYTVKALLRAGVLDKENAERLERCRIFEY